MSGTESASDRAEGTPATPTPEAESERVHGDSDAVLPPIEVNELFAHGSLNFEGGSPLLPDGATFEVTHTSREAIPDEGLGPFVKIQADDGTIHDWPIGKPFEFPGTIVGGTFFHPGESQPTSHPTGSIAVDVRLGVGDVVVPVVADGAVVTDSVVVAEPEPTPIQAVAFVEVPIDEDGTPTDGPAQYTFALDRSCTKRQAMILGEVLDEMERAHLDARGRESEGFKSQTTWERNIVELATTVVGERVDSEGGQQAMNATFRTRMVSIAATALAAIEGYDAEEPKSNARKVIIPKSRDATFMTPAEKAAFVAVIRLIDQARVVSQSNREMDGINGRIYRLMAENLYRDQLQVAEDMIGGALEVVARHELFEEMRASRRPNGRLAQSMYPGS